MSEKNYCYIPDEKRVHVVCEITKGFDTDEYTVLLLDDDGNKPKGQSEIKTISASETYPIESLHEILNPPSDLIQLTNVHGPAILNTLRSRFHHDNIYTSIGPILIACNPFRWIKGIYDKDVIVDYHSGNRNQSEHPHVFAMAHESLLGLQYGKNQSLIISGESGAGKTEATKQCLNYIAEVAGSSTGVHHRILQANPILEGWGNAKTLRNNNSSRFGKFIELLISAASGEIVGSTNTTYLLEKSRVVFQEEGERNYHVFYQLLFGAPNDIIQEFHLDYLKSNPQEVMCINQSGCMFIDGVDDHKDFVEVDNAQKDIGFDPADYRMLLQSISGILHLCNIEFVEDVEDSEGTSIKPHPQDYLGKAGNLLGLELENFTRSLLFKAVRGGGRRTSVSFKKYTPVVAIENRNALAKEIYKRCFDYIVGRINASINAEPEILSKIKTSMIGILDIFGFEIFKKNSFEQLCINLANEALQKHFNTNIFEMEMSIYLAEDIVVPDLSYKDNQDVLDLVIKKPKGLIPMLDEEGQVPRGSWEGFLRKFTTHHAQNSRLKYRQGLQHFTIVHYAGDVTYDPSLFIVKNKDTLSADLSDAMHCSTLPLIQQLFQADDSKSQRSTSGRKSSIASKQTVGTGFRVQLDQLIANLNSTSPKYIRCVKPNAQKKPNIFDSALTNEQLTYSGVFEAVIIMQNGYPFRLGLWEFKQQYHMLVDFRQCCECFSEDRDEREKLRDFVELLRQVNEEFSLCHVGKTLVFYRAEQHRLLEKMRIKKISAARSILHRICRGFVAKNFFCHILLATNRCVNAILARDIKNMRECADYLNDLKERLENTYNGTSIRLKQCSSIAYEFAEALELEDQLNSELTDLMDSKHDIFIIFNSLEACVERAKSLSYFKKFQSEELSVKWEDNEIISNAIMKVSKYKDIIAIKRNLESSLSNNNDVELEKWLHKLERARASGDVDSKFCAAEAKQGSKIVKAAQAEFDEFVSEINDAILTGNFSYTLDSNDKDDDIERFLHFQSSVDSSLISAVLLAFEEKYTNKDQSVKLQNLLKLCYELKSLRSAAESQDWNEVWSLLHPWKLYVRKSISDSRSDVDTFDTNVDEQLIPVIPQFQRSLSREIKALYDCTISSLKFMEIANEINQVKIPGDFQLKMPAVSAASHVEVVTSHLLSCEEISYTSDDLQLAVKNISERILIRRFIMSQSLDDLHSFLSPNTSRTLPSADPDMLLAQKWLNFFNVCNDLWCSLRECVPTGTAGSINFGEYSPTKLPKILQVCSSMSVNPSDQWDDILNYCTKIHQVWQFLQKGEMKEALPIIETVAIDYSKQSSGAESYVERPSVDALHSNVKLLVENEFALYRREVEHVLGLQKLQQVLADGAVTGEVGNLNVVSVGIHSLEKCLSTIKKSLIRTNDIVQLISDCNLLMDLRNAVKESEWDSLLTLTKHVYEESSGFSSTHPFVLKEFETIHGEAQDLQARRRVSDAITTCSMISSSSGEVTAQEDVEDSLKNLAAAIDFCLSQSSLSSEANLLVSNAYLIYCCRKSVAMSLWEGDMFCLKGVETSRLSEDIFSNTVEPKRLNLFFELLKTQQVAIDENLHKMYLSTKKNIFSPVDRILRIARGVEVHELAYKEISMVRQGSIERRCRLILILALSVNRISGVVGDIKTVGASIQNLLRGIEYVKLFESQISNSLHQWIEGALFILNFRLFASSRKDGDLSGICSYFTAEYLKKCGDFLQRACSMECDSDRSGDSENSTAITTFAFGFPFTELKLVVDHIGDCMNVMTLTEAINLGRVQFFENKFDTKVVSYSHVLQVLDEIKKSSVRSDKLDRLMFYAELCVFLRRALMSNNWEASVTGKSKRGASVRQCLVDYEEANQYFTVKMKDMPPPFLKEEFRITQRELDRQSILLGFSSAFQSGQITGTNGCLNLQDISYQRLSDQVDKSKDWMDSSGVKDADLDLYVTAALELIQVRKRVIEVQNKYKSDIKFPKPSNSLRTIIQCGFISDAINNAVSRVKNIDKYPFELNTEWTQVEMALSKMKVAMRLRQTRQQVELLHAETFQRQFCGNILHLFHGLPRKVAGPLSTKQALNASSFLHGWCRSYNIHRKEMDKLCNNSIRPDSTTEVLYQSAVALTHLLRAEANEQYDAFDRKWMTSDKYPPFGTVSKSSHSDQPLPPTFRMLSLNTDKTEFSVQSILRASSKWKFLHPAVRHQINRAIRHIEDEVTVAELSFCLTEGKATGSVGEIDYSSLSLTHIRSALERTYEFTAIELPVKKKNRNRNSNGRFRFSSKFTPNEVCCLEESIGFRQVMGENYQTKVEYGDVTPEAISKATNNAASEQIPRNDVVSLRHTCELIYELREALRMKNFTLAYNIIYDNIGEDNQSFKELLDTIYGGNFSLHILGVEEFSLMAFEVCENYCCLQACNVLTSHRIEGSRIAFNLFAIHEASYTVAMQEVLSMIEGLVQVSPGSAQLRELCCAINHMREIIINGSFYRDQEQKISKKRSIQIVDCSDDIQSLLKLHFLKDAMNNAFANVKVICVDKSRLDGLDYGHLITALAVANKVESQLALSTTPFLLVSHRDTLTRECRLVRDHCLWYTRLLSIKRIMCVDMTWYSFSTGTLECDPSIRFLLQSSVEEMRSQNIDQSKTAEKQVLRFFEIADTFCTILTLSSADQKEIIEKDKICITSDYFFEKVKPVLKSLIRLVDVYDSSTALFPLSSAFSKQVAEIRKVVSDCDNYDMLYKLSLDPVNFVIGRGDKESDAITQTPLLLEEYPETKPSDTIEAVSKIEMFSLPCSRFKTITLLILQMRQAILLENFAQAEEFYRNFEVANVLNLCSPEVTLIKELCDTISIKRHLEQGIVSCILPPVAGWSNFSTAPSLAISIMDYPLREALPMLCGGKPSTSTRDKGDEDFDFDSDDEEMNPILDELGDVGQLMISVIAAIRRQVWSQVYCGSNNDVTSLSSIREKFVNLFPVSPSLDSPVDTSKLNEAFDDIFLIDENDKNVSVALSTLQDSCSKSQFLSATVRGFVDSFISSVQIEQEIFELSNLALAAICEQKTLGLPGNVTCTSDSVDVLGFAHDRITEKQHCVESSPGLKRILQSLKILQLARTAVFKNNWTALGPILQLYVYMRSLDKFDAEKNCADLMYHHVMDRKSIVTAKSSDFERIISHAADKFKENIDNNKVNSRVSIVNDTPSQDIQDHAQVLLGVNNYNSLLQSIPELEAEMKLLNNHYFFEKARHIFDVGLTTSPAVGLPGELITEGLRFDLFHDVCSILSDNGLLSYASGKHLHLCSLAMVELRVGQRSGRLADIQESLVKLNSIRNEETENSGEKYLGKAFAELDLARLDVEQQELSQYLYSGLLDNRLPSGNNSFDHKLEKKCLDNLTVILKECTKRKISSKRCRILFKSIQLLMSLRELLLSNSKRDLLDVISAYDVTETGVYDDMMMGEVECAQRLLCTSEALSIAEAGIHSGRIAGTVENIDLSEVVIEHLAEAKNAFSQVKSEWKTLMLSCYENSCKALFSVRESAAKGDWSRVLDLSSLALMKHNLQFPLVETVYDEIVLAREHAVFVVVEAALVDSLLNGRMDGDVGEIESTTVSTQYIKDALYFTRKYESQLNSYPRLRLLKDTAEIILDLRRAQLADTWMLDPSRVDRDDKRLLPDPDTMAVTMSLVPLNWLASAGGNIMKNVGMTGLSTLMKKYLDASKHLEEARLQASLQVRMDAGEPGWLIQCNMIENYEIDDDTSTMKSVTDDVVADPVTVQQILANVNQFENIAAPEALPELAFAQEEINHRHIVQMLLGAMTSQGFRGQAGKLDCSSVDLHPLERAIFFAENDMDNSDRGKCKWMLRDAKLLFKARKFRVEKRWPELNKVLLDVSATNIFTKKVDDEGNVVKPRPMLPFSWKEISLIRADMHFYTCLSEFAQEMTSRSGKSLLRSRRKGIEGKSLTGLLRVLLRTLSAAELHPSMEFDRLVEAENVALELRTHMTFDSLVSPREVILKVLNIKERDKRNRVPSYICLLMPDISMLSDVLDTEQLVESLEATITKGQLYLRAALGSIDSNDIDLEGIRSAIHTAMPLLSLTGSKENLSLLSVATALLAIRAEVAVSNWIKVDKLLEKHEFLLRQHDAILSEEISRLQIEIENFYACEAIENALIQGRCKDVYDLVDKLSSQRRSSLVHTRSGSMIRKSSMTTGMSGFSLNQFQVILDNSSDETLSDLDKAIEEGMRVRNRAIATTTMLRAAVLIRSLRAAIQAAMWEEVQTIIDEESSYLRFPQICLDEIKEVKAAMSYRSSMTTLSRSILNGAISGMPGELNISQVDVGPLDDAISQTETLEIFDPATSNLLLIAKYICDLRRAVLAAKWFKPRNVEEEEENSCADDFDFEITKKVQFEGDFVSTDSDNLIPFADSVQERGNLSMEMINEEEEFDSEEERNDSVLDVIAEGDESEEDDEEEERDVASTHADSSECSSVCDIILERGVDACKSDSSIATDVQFGADCAVEELLTVMDKRLRATNDLQEILDDRSLKSTASEDTKRVAEWIEIQVKAIESAKNEISLLKVELNERRRVDILVSVLEKVPLPTREFNNIECAPSFDSRKHKRETLHESQNDLYLIKPLELAIKKAQSIPGEMTKETNRIFNTAELILCFRKTMKSMEIEKFKELLTRAKDYSSQGKLSLHCGLYELNSYRSATMTVTLTKAELLNSLASGRVTGPLHELNVADIEIEALDFWVTSCSDLMGMSQELMVGLVDAYQEAKVMLDLRKSVVEDNWEEVDDKLDKYFDLLYKFEFGSVELKHIQYASKYRTVKNSIFDLLEDNIPTDSTNLPAYILPKIEPLEKAIIYGKRIIEYEAEHISQCNYDKKSEFASVCRNADSVLTLWKSILTKRWQCEIVASGQVHLLPRPNDSLLNVYFESVRQHEVSQRLGLVHEQLAILNLTGEKTVHNLRKSVRMSIRVMDERDALESTDGLDSLSHMPNVSRDKCSMPGDKSLEKRSSIRSSLSGHHIPSAQTFEEKRKEEKLRLRQPPRQNETVSSKNSVYDIMSTRRISQSQRRKSSIGGMISRILGIDDSTKNAKQKKQRNLSVVIKKDDDYANIPGVAVVVCEQDWSTLSKLALLHFENARNILINKVTLIRVQWGCKEGCAKALPDGNVCLSELSVELLEVALSDCRRISFYGQQAKSSFKFSDDVQSLLKVANKLYDIRSTIMANRVDELMSQLKLFNSAHDKSDMSITLTKFPEIESELRLFDKFSHEYVAENVLNNAIAYLASQSWVSSATVSHSSILEINNLETNNRSIGEMTNSYVNTVKISKLLRRALVSAVMCNQYILRELESNIFRLVGNPGSPFVHSKKQISKIFAILRKCSFIRNGSVGRESNLAGEEGTVVSRRMSIKPASLSSGASQSIPGNAFSKMYNALDNFDKDGFVTEVKSDELEPGDNGPELYTDKMARLKLLPETLLHLIDCATIFDCQQVNVSFDTPMYMIPKSEFALIEDIFSDPDFIYANIWLPANEGVLFDPLWIVVGQAIVSDIRISSKMLSLSTVTTHDNYDLDKVRALAGIILSNHDLIHQSSYDILLKTKMNSTKTSRKLDEIARPEIGLSDVSLFVNSLHTSFRFAEEQMNKSEEIALSNVRVSLYGDGKKKSRTILQASNVLNSVILNFQERIGEISSQPPNEFYDVRFDRKRYQKRLLLTCTKLLQLLNSFSEPVAHARQRDVKLALIKRRRQFNQSQV